MEKCYNKLWGVVVMNSNQLYKNYNTNIFKNAHSKNDFEEYHKYFKKNYLKHLNNKKLKILDVGCGMGHFLYFLKKEGFENFCGIDISAEQIKLCKKNDLFNVKTTSVEKFLKLNKAKFDVIIFNDIVEHWTLKENLKFLTGFYKVLNKDGKVIIKTINLSNPITGPSGRYIDLTHKMGFTEESLSFLLKKSNFENVEIYPQNLLYKYTPLFILANIATKFLELIFLIIFRLYGRNTTKIFTKHIIGVGIK